MASLSVDKRDRRAMTPLDKALQRLAQLQREEAELRKFISMYQQLEGDGVHSHTESGRRVDDKQLKGNDDDKEGNLPVDNYAQRNRKNRPPGPTPKETAALMERVIRERGEPMSRGEIVQAFDRRDVEIPAQDKARYVGTIAWRNKGTFVNIEGLGYWIRGLPFVGKRPLDPSAFSDPPEEKSDELQFD